MFQPVKPLFSFSDFPTAWPNNLRSSL